MSNQTDADTTATATEPPPLSIEERLAKLERLVANIDADMTRAYSFMGDLSARLKRAMSSVGHNLAMITKSKNGR